MNKDWHSGHFCCWQCDETLTGQRYVLRDEHPYCIKCYESVFANPCDECDKIIGIDSKVSSPPFDVCHEEFTEYNHDTNIGRNFPNQSLQIKYLFFFNFISFYVRFVL